MHQCGRFERHSRAASGLAPESGGGKLSQFRINKLNQLIRRPRIPGLQLAQRQRDFMKARLTWFRTHVSGPKNLMLISRASIKRRIALWLMIKRPGHVQ
jgi:hypothetical protein